MIGCDDCENWFHPKCLEKLGIDVSQILNIAEFPFSCSDCTQMKDQVAMELEKNIRKQEKQKENQIKLVKEVNKKEYLKHKKRINEEVIKAMDEGRSEGDAKPESDNSKSTPKTKKKRMLKANIKQSQQLNQDNISEKSSIKDVLVEQPKAETPL